MSNKVDKQIRSGASLTTTIVLVLAILKLLNITTMSWFWVISPWIISLIISTLIVIVICILLLINITK